MKNSRKLKPVGFVIERKFVYCEVGAEFVYFMKTNNRPQKPCPDRGG
jgi:hypothetical protein